MKLLKTTFLTGFSSLIKLISSYLMWKIIAIYTGPTGLAIIEQFQNFIQICRSFSCSLNQGVIKYVAEYEEDITNKSKIISSALGAYIIGSFVIAIILFAFNSFLSEQVFHSLTYKNNITLLAISLILFSLNNLFLSILNGEFEIKKYITCNIINTIMIFCITTYLIIHYGIQGGLIGFNLNQSIVLFLTIYLLKKSKCFNLSLYLQGIDWASIKKLSKYGLMSFVPILIVPISLVVSRRYIAYQLSWQEAGYWQGIMKLSDGYLILLEMVLSIYFLPRLSAIKTHSEFKSEIFNSYRLIFPIVLLGPLSVFILKKHVVTLLYTAEFFPMLILFKYQLTGDIARISTWFLSNILVAKAKVTFLVTTEIFFNITYVLSVIIFVHYFGLIGTAIGFTINSILHFITMLIYTLYCIKKDSFHLIDEPHTMTESSSLISETTP